MYDKVKEMAEMIRKSNHIVFFTGAGVSTISGIKDFRSVDGLYQSKEFALPPEEMLSYDFFCDEPAKFFDFYKKVFDVRKYEPNIVHKIIASLEHIGKCSGVITQNIDGLHTKAGSKNVVEYHGSIYRNKCMNCGKEFGPEAVFDITDTIPLCECCGCVIKPVVTLYGERPEGIQEADRMVYNADLLIVLGTSLNVYPAANIVSSFKPYPYIKDYDKQIILVNRQETDFDYCGDVVIHDDLKTVFEALQSELEDILL